MCPKIWCDGESWKFLGTKHGLSDPVGEGADAALADCGNEWDNKIWANPFGASIVYDAPRLRQAPCSIYAASRNVEMSEIIKIEQIRLERALFMLHQGRGKRLAQFIVSYFYKK